MMMEVGATTPASPSSMVSSATSSARSAASSSSTSAATLLPWLMMRRGLVLPAILLGIPSVLGLPLGHPLFFVVAVLNLMDVRLFIVEVGGIASPPTELDYVIGIDELGLIVDEIHVDAGMGAKELGVLPIFRPWVCLFFLLRRLGFRRSIFGGLRRTRSWSRPGSGMSSIWSVGTIVDAFALVTIFCLLFFLLFLSQVNRILILLRYCILTRVRCRLVNLTILRYLRL
mmetsp:Transcript_29451/g.85697  ORF Transcript_29451/g.85697 Transcript_29451/m.85697 type:complete len:229 (-) Transcript_29451:914-1600(-)